MVDEQDISRQMARLQDILQDKLGTRGNTLARGLSKAGRRLPRHIRNAGKIITDAQVLMDHPKLSRQIDPTRLNAAFITILSHLDTIDPADRRKGIVLNLLGSIALNLLAFCGLLLAFLYR